MCDVTLRTSAPDGGVRSVTHSRQRCGTACIGGLGDRLNVLEKRTAPVGILTLVLQPVVSHFTDWEPGVEESCHQNYSG